MSKPSSDYIVVKVINDSKLVINKGSLNEVKPGQRFLIYSVDPEPLIDPVTNESLGYLEIVKGTGKVTHVQPNLATIESDSYSSPSKRITRNTGMFAHYDTRIVEEIDSDRDQIPFEDPLVGDLAKPI